MASSEVRAAIRRGLVIPAQPLALDANRKLDERRQRALTRYYLSAGVGGIAVGVHTTQFAIRERGLLRPVLELAAEEDRRVEQLVVKVAGICGPTKQAVAEASLAREIGYDVGLLSLAALKDAPVDALIDHARAVGEVLPLFGFYLQPTVGGRLLPHAFWRRFAELPSVLGIKIAPFNRYQTIDVVRAVAESGRAGEISLYTGNDDAIVADLLTEWRIGGTTQRIVGGLLGHWSVWTRKAVELLAEVKEGKTATSELLARGARITDSNAAFFDAANGFAGCIAGLHEVLRRQGLLEGLWCLDPHEGLSPGQAAEIDRVYAAYPELNDDAFVAAHRDTWLAS
jgi:dihydrodipicolinate synthase/N-acetylneuraminate lyase